MFERSPHGEKVSAFLRTEIGNNATDPAQEAWIVCSAALRRCALSLLKASSIGLRSGEYFGR